MPRPASGGVSIRRALTALAWSFVLFTGVHAQDREPLTPAAIAAFEQQLTAARATHDDIAARVTCFGQQKTSLIQQRDKDQLKLGALMRHKLELEPALAVQEAEYRGFEKTRNSEQAELNRLNQELDHMQQRKASQDRALADCKADPWKINALCELAYKLAQLTGRFVDYEPQIADTRRRLEIAGQAARDSESRYRDSKRAYDATVTDMGATREEIGAAETAIKRWQAALTTLETNAHDSKLLLDEFDDALDEARRVDTADGRARTARTVRGLAVRVDAATQRSSVLLGQAKTTLTEQQLRSCF